jgi:UDP-N-acetylglucosamine--N-acetylmuramyl-(pentapeptide) pyrophosphoryl-undecaprenol N-acetylglucosamine transferase
MTVPSQGGMPLVVLAAGGTGGHMFPAEALAKALIGHGIGVALFTDRRGQAFGDALPAVSVHRVRASRLPRGILDRVRALGDMLLGVLDAWRLLRRLRPAVVVGFGGYPSIPTIAAALWCKIPVVLHEQNALAGRANRMLAGRARVVATSFETVAGLPRGVPTALTGNPVRPGILAIRGQSYVAPAENAKLSILVTGGSQGARIFSEIIPAAMALLPKPLRARIRVVQQCRAEDIAGATAAFEKAGIQAELATFFTDMPALLADCHLVICRAGASTLAELGVAGRPAILVPFPFATDDHQTANAEAFVRGGGGWVISQRILTPQFLAERISALLSRPDTLARAADAARREGRPDAADRLAALVMAPISDGKSQAVSKDIAAKDVAA